VAAWSLARCFLGPGEVVPALAAVVAADLTILGATALSRRSRGLGAALAALGPILVVLVPIWIVAGGATTWGWPTFSTWHVVGSELSRAWETFNALRAPVPELAGFTLVGAWAVGGAALLAGWAADGGDTPLWVVAPPTAIFLFTSALGTAGWRPLSITAFVAALGWYAASARAARRMHNAALAERVASPSGERSRRLSIGVAWPAVAIVSIAALLGGLLGPRLPGASSPALVSLRNTNGPDAASGQVIPVPDGGQISIDTMVQVAQSEIYQSTADFFVTTTQVPAYTVLTTLDQFDGDHWTASQGALPVGDPLPYEGAPMEQPQRVDGGRYLDYEFQLQVQKLGGQDVPAPAVPQRGEGPGGLNYDAPHETLTLATGLDSNMIFDVISQVPLRSPADAPDTLGTLSPELAADVALPEGIPPQIVQLAHQIVADAHANTDFEKALAIEQYFQSGRYHYDLPQSAPGSSQTVTGGEGLYDLQQFLFQTRTGFCQQYASAFAVLARIEGLPTRIAVGFTPGKLVSPGQYQVTGIDVHAWPQVYLGGDWGWWSFEPTPGNAIPTLPYQSAGKGAGKGGNSAQGSNQINPHLHSAAHNIKGSTGGNGHPDALPPIAVHPVHRAGGGGGPSAGLVWLMILGLLVLLLAAAPVSRLVRRRRARGASGRVVTAWSDATSALSLVGVYHHDGETYDELARRVGKTGSLPSTACDQLVRLARHTTVAAYAPAAPPPEVVREAVAASNDVCAAVRRTVSPWRRSWAAVDPRGVLESRSR
jgi:transglutaminase-like putative cysteine protease